MTLKKKVVVEGLGRVTQPLRTTVPRGYGQTPVQVEKATPWQETGIGKLSQALGLGIQIAGQVKQIGDIKEEKAVQDLVDLPDEVIDKELSNNRGQFDKLTRNGFPFGGNPWNYERVQKASGALLGDKFEVKLQEALTNAPYDSDVDSIVNDVIAEMSEEHSRLSTPAAHDGFREAIKGTIQQYKLRYNANKNAQKKDIVYKSGVSVLFKAAQTVTKRNEQGEEEEVGDYAKIANWWKENEGAFLPQEKLKMIKEVGVALAEKDSDEARKWVQWAGGHLKIGTALMGDPTQTDDDVFGAFSSEVADLYSMIDQIEDRNEGKAKGDANLLLTEIDAKVTADILALSSGNIPKDAEGNLLDTKDKIRDYYIKEAQASGNIYVQGSNGIAAIQKAIEVAELPPEEHLFRLKSNVDQLYNSSTGYKTFSQLLSDTDQTIQKTFLLSQDDFLDDGKPNEEGRKALIGLQNLANSVRQEIANERMDKLRELSSGSYVPFGSDEVKTSSDLQGVVAKDMRAWDKHFSDEYKKRYNERLKDYNKKIEAASLVKGVQPQTIENAKSYVFPDKKIADVKRSFLSFQNNFGNLEEAILSKDLEAAKVVAEDLEQFQYNVDYLWMFGNPIPIVTTQRPVVVMLNRLKNAESTAEEKEQARRALGVYAIGKGVYTAENISKGEAVVSFGTKPGKEIRIPIDKEAVKKLLPLYPIIPRQRLIEIQQNPKDVAAELNLYNSIFDTNYTADDEEAKQVIIDFIDQQMKVTVQ